MCVALLYICLGLAMTVKRLGEGGEPAWFGALFFARIATLVFYQVSSVKPSAVTDSEEGAPWPARNVIERWIPRTRAASALVSIGLTAVIGVGFTFLGTQVIAQYGWGLFVGMPFCPTLVAPFTHSYHPPC